MTQTPGTTPIRSKHEQVYEYLHDAIIKGAFEPGVRLVIDDLAEQLGVSQIPIREALRQLEAAGFVTIAPYVGATVTPLAAGSIREIFALLEAMETITGRAACAHISEQTLASLEALLYAMDTLVDQPEDWSQGNRRFHLLVSASAGMPLAERFFTGVLDHWNRLRRYYLETVSGQRIKIAQREHWDILAALQARDATQTVALLQAHNQGALQAYLAHLETAGVLATEDTTGRG